MTELKPCPFCGGAAKVCSRYRKGVANCVMYWIECKACGAAQSHHELSGYNSTAKATRAWNRRENESDLISRQDAIDALNELMIYRPLDSDRYVISDCLNKIVNIPRR